MPTTNTPWWLTAKFYELYVDKFAGTFNGLTERIPYFTALGVNTLHILPHYPSPMVDQGYDVSDYRGVRSELGTLDDMKRFMDAAHSAGLRVILDLVVNHVSDQHPWFQEARSSKSNPKRDYFLWSDSQEKFKDGINAFSDIKSSNWIWNETTKDCYYATFYPQQPDLNWDNNDVYEEMVQVIDFLTGLGADGFRFDAVAHMVKRDGTTCKNLPEVHQRIKRIRKHLDERHPNTVLLAEAGVSLPELKQYFGNSDEFHLAYNFPLTNALWQTLLTGERSWIEHAMAESGGIPSGCQWATFLRNHDDIDWRGLPRNTFLHMIDMVDPRHDYTFNHGMTTSLRLATALRNDPAKIREAFELLYSIPGAPVCYYGDEIGMQNLPRDPAVADTRLCVRGPFDWAEAERQMSDPHSLHASVAALIRGKH